MFEEVFLEPKTGVNGHQVASVTVKDRKQPSAAIGKCCVIERAREEAIFLRGPLPLSCCFGNLYHDHCLPKNSLLIYATKILRTQEERNAGTYLVREQPRRDTVRAVLPDFLDATITHLR